MPFSYLQPKRILALRLAQIVGTSSTTLETAYTGSWATMLDGAEIPLTNFKDSILYIAKEIAQAIANAPSHPSRSFLYCRTADLANGDQTPTVDENGVEVIGTWDSCADADDLTPLTWQPSQTITDENKSFFSDTDIYNYNITGNFIRTTRPLVFLQGCCWDAEAQSELYDDDGDCPLPEAFEALLCDGVTARAAQVGWVDGAGVAPYYAEFYQQGLADIARVGQSSMPLSAARNPVAG
jgi:hypothetical protein